MKLKYYVQLMKIGYMASVMDPRVSFHQIASQNFLMIYKTNSLVHS